MTRRLDNHKVKFETVSRPTKEKLGMADVFDFVTPLVDGQHDTTQTQKVLVGGVNKTWGAPGFEATVMGEDGTFTSLGMFPTKSKAGHAALMAFYGEAWTLRRTAKAEKTETATDTAEISEQQVDPNRARKDKKNEAAKAKRSAARALALA